MARLPQERLRFNQPDPGNKPFSPGVKLALLSHGSAWVSFRCACSSKPPTATSRFCPCARRPVTIMIRAADALDRLGQKIAEPDCAPPRELHFELRTAQVSKRAVKEATDERHLMTRDKLCPEQGNAPSGKRIETVRGIFREAKASVPGECIAEILLATFRAAHHRPAESTTNLTPAPTDSGPQFQS